MKLSEKLKRERTEYGRLSDGKTWIEIQTEYLKEHEFITGTARLLRNVSMEDQINGLQTVNE
jgi:hypothetical protein